MYKVYLLLRIIFYPVFRYILPFINKKINKRIEFELLNRVNISALPKAGYGFEISSEGELEQVKILIQYLLDQKENIEIIYCSDSVESQCLKLMADNPDRVRLLRLPIFTFNPMSTLNNPSKWLTCHTFFMCRYDLFPELLNYGKRNDINFILLSGAVKNFSSKNILEKIYLKKAFNSFNKIVSVTQQSKDDFVKIIGFSDRCLEVFDFRIPQVLNRLLVKEETISRLYPQLVPYINYLGTLPENKKIVFGSFWDDEFDILASHQEKISLEDYHISLVPHKLDSESLTDLREKIISSGFEVYEITASMNAIEVEALISSNRNSNGIWIINLKGILCEFYSYFNRCYVGGGFGVSIHSVLEPFLNNNHIFCGPKTKRSSEFDMIHERFPDQIYSVENKNEVFIEMISKETLTTNEDTKAFIEKYSDEFPRIVSWLNLPEFEKDEYVK
jgi:3-deoxy-D-manno-octulosonic-acid transferase